MRKQNQANKMVSNDYEGVEDEETKDVEDTTLHYTPPQFAAETLQAGDSAVVGTFQED